MKYQLLLIFSLFVVTVKGQNKRNSGLHSPQGIALIVPITPRAVIINGALSFFYELHISNFSKTHYIINKLEVIHSKDSSALFVLEQEGIRNRMYKPGAISDSSAPTALKPGHFAVIYMELKVSDKDKPISIFHSITLKTGDKSPEQINVLESASVPVLYDSIILGFPLRGGPWTAVYEPSWERGHRRVIYTSGGIPHIPGRFAIDFIKLDEMGRVAAQDRNITKYWYGYDLEVYAVADGIIASTLDNFPESPTLSGHPKYSAEDATGNYISMKIEENRFVFYEHLKPGSILVKPGQKVKKGDIIARVGFTGQTTGPHLHLHVADSDSPLGAEGLPFVFDKFTVLGSFPDMNQFGNMRWQSLHATLSSGVRRNERPPPNCVIKFN